MNVHRRINPKSKRITDEESFKFHTRIRPLLPAHYLCRPSPFFQCTFFLSPLIKRPAKNETCGRKSRACFPSRPFYTQLLACQLYERLVYASFSINSTNGTRDESARLLARQNFSRNGGGSLKRLKVCLVMVETPWYTLNSAAG